MPIISKNGNCLELRSDDKAAYLAETGMKPVCRAIRVFARRVAPRKGAWTEIQILKNMG
jgi:hypothetical protein